MRLMSSNPELGLTTGSPNDIEDSVPEALEPSKDHAPTDLAVSELAVCDRLKNGDSSVKSVGRAEEVSLTVLGTLVSQLLNELEVDD
jgi:hypothetical protein